MKDSSVIVMPVFQLSTVIGELQSHLAGEYSLADAVRELKEVRSQVRVRDSQLTQLTTLVNTLQININDLLDENCQLRSVWCHCHPSSGNICYSHFSFVFYRIESSL